MLRGVKARSAASALALALVTVGCSGDDDAATGETTVPGSDSPSVPGSATPLGSDLSSIIVTLPTMLMVDGAPIVAATTWSAAFARAAGAEEVTVLVPPGTDDPFGYVADADELVAVTEADFVVVDGREALIDDITDALPTDGEIITFTLSNDPAEVDALVLGLAERFMVGSAGRDWSRTFNQALERWQAVLDGARPDPAPTAIVDESLSSWARLAGLDVVASFDGGALTDEEAATLAAHDADLVLLATESRPPDGVDLGDAEVVQLTNFPDESLDLMVLFQSNVDRLVAAMPAD
ncbi:MAG: hypothetical protein ACK5OX_02350 [Desertimonas sp.]